MCKKNVDSTDFFSRENDCWLGVKYGYRPPPPPPHPPPPPPFTIDNVNNIRGL